MSARISTTPISTRNKNELDYFFTVDFAAVLVIALVIATTFYLAFSATFISVFIGGVVGGCFSDRDKIFNR